MQKMSTEVAEPVVEGALRNHDLAEVAEGWVGRAVGAQHAVRPTAGQRCVRRRPAANCTIYGRSFQPKSPNLHLFSVKIGTKKRPFNVKYAAGLAARAAAKGRQFDSAPDPHSDSSGGKHHGMD